VQDIVDDIMRDYRDRQQELGNVDNWGQPKEKLDKRKVEKWVRDNLPKLGGDEGQTSKRGKKQFMPSAPEGLSEAIGDKLRGKSDGQKDKPTTKTPKIGKPERSTPKEKKFPTQKFPSKRESGSKMKIPPLKENTGKQTEPRKKPSPIDSRKSRPVVRDLKAPQNKECKEQLGLKLKMNPLEIQARKVESLKTPTESFSEVIGKKFKQEQEDRSSTEKKRTMENPIKDTKAGTIHEVKIYLPEVRGMKIQSEAELRKFVNEELSGMKHMPNFDKIMNDAIAHINLRKLVGERNTLSFPEIRKISNQIDVPLRTTRKWTTESGMPKFYKLAESAITKTEAKKILDHLKASRNGVDSVKELESRLTTLYIHDHVKQLTSYNRDMETSRKYYKFLENLSEGGIVTDAARRAGVSPLAGRNYINGIFPHLVKRVADVPPVIPKDGWKWLPKQIGDTRQFIEVPLKVTNWNEVQHVLKQIEPLTGAQMKRWQSMFGSITKEEAFMYSLGAIIADGSLNTAHMSSRMTLALSKKYNWSPNFGEGVCHCLGVLGIRAERGKDWDAPNNLITERGKKRRITGPGFHTWESKHDPLLRWMRDSCLGLSATQNKIKTPIEIEWALTAPIELRKKILQGIADGDGYVSVNSQYIGLSTRVNQPFYGRLLKSFDVESIPTSKDVLVKQSESILKVAEIGLFKHAESRQESLEELRLLVHERKTKSLGSRLSKEEIDFAMTLRGENKSYGEITRTIFRKYGNSWDISTIEHAIKRRQASTKI
jgi:hypothetical protein